MDNPPTLSPRLKALADLVPVGKTVADIGTDHAALPIYLVELGLISAAVATEKAAGPYRVALTQVQKSGLAHRIAVRLGDGLTPLEEGEAEVIVLAGMGAGTIISILEGDPGKSSSADRILAQPMAGSEKLRAWIREKGCLLDEEIVREGGRLYEIEVFRTGRANEVFPAMAWARSLPPEWRTGAGMALIFGLGPILLAKRHPLFPALLEEKIRRWERILTVLEKGRGGKIGQKKEELLSRLQLARRLHNCWSEETPVR